MSAPTTSRILSIQSHVTRDYVGNRAAVFPLQFMGYTVDSINSVNFSSMYVHKGFVATGKDAEDVMFGLLQAFKDGRSGGFPGSVMDGVFEEVDSAGASILQTSAMRVGLDYTDIISGYIADVEFVRSLVQLVSGLKRHQPCSVSCGSRVPRWVCDPVLGDLNRLYVDEQMIAVYCTEVLRWTDVITPNQFEAQWLAGRQLCSEADAVECCVALHRLGPRVVVVTSAAYRSDASTLHLIFSEMRGDDVHVNAIPFERKQIYFGGTGDLITALITANLNHFDLSQTCQRSLAVVQDIIDFTLTKDASLSSIDVVGGRHCLTTPYDNRYEVKQLKKC